MGLKSKNSTGYDETFIALVEMIYGEGLLSQGGEQSIQDMFSGYNLEGMKALDIGCGLGMYDILLAKYHSVEIIGIDPHPLMIERACHNLAKFKEDLKGRVSFIQNQASLDLDLFSENTFDLIFSKESILHIPLNHKKNFFNEIYRVLKPNGHLIIMDWLHRDPNYSESVKKMMEMDQVTFALLTPLEYMNLLEQCGFSHCLLEDTTAEHAALSQQNIARIHQLEDKIKTHFGEKIYLSCLKSWEYQKDAFERRELLTGILRAKKNKN